MNFLELDPETGKVVCYFGATRQELRKYYKKCFPFTSIYPEFNRIAPEFKGKQQLPASVVKKIIQDKGLAFIKAEPSLI